MKKESIDWMQFAACKNTDPNVFFPTTVAGTDAAKEICGQCAVRLACFDYAIEHIENVGIWGGTTELERKKIVRSKAIPKQNDKIVGDNYMHSD